MTDHRRLKGKSKVGIKGEGTSNTIPSIHEISFQSLSVTNI
jgi:hypothetical protein